MLHLGSHVLHVTSEVLQETYGDGHSHTWIAKLKRVVTLGEAVKLILMCVLSLLCFACCMVFKAVEYVILLLSRSFWQLVLWMAFVFWIAFYRYPLFDVLYSMVQAKVSTNNMAVYRRLIGPNVIRIVRLEAGSREDPIVCTLVTGRIEDLEYEALSYAWGVDLFPYRIRLDSKPFYVTSNLHAALQGLRLPQQDRFLWIDALCINQSDNREKSSQVQMMRSIYGRALMTRVYLGPANADTASVFALLRHWKVEPQGWREVSDDNPPSAPEHRTSPLLRELWKLILHQLWVRARNKAQRDDKLTLNRSEFQDQQYWFMLQEFWDMVDHEWWQRTWVIQEVVVSPMVILQRGTHTVAWDDFCKMLDGPNFRNHTAAIHFAKSLKLLRNHAQVSKGSEPLSLLNLVHMFRFQCATLGSDKIYALQGLLPAIHQSLLSPDYGRSTEEVYMQFTVSFIA